MQRQALITSLFLLVPAAAACSDPSDPSRALVDAELGGVVESADGKLRLEIPPGALVHDTEIRVSLVPPDEWPADIAGFAPATDVYDLQPEGLQFSTPARLVQAFEHDHDTEFPLLLGASRSADGELSLMSDPSTSYDADGGTATFTADLHHFSQTFTSTRLRKYYASGRYAEADDMILWVERAPRRQVVDQPWSTDAQVTTMLELVTVDNLAERTGEVELVGGTGLDVRPKLEAGVMGLGAARWMCRAEGSGTTTRYFRARFPAPLDPTVQLSAEIHHRYDCDFTAADPTTGEGSSSEGTSGSESGEPEYATTAPTTAATEGDGGWEGGGGTDATAGGETTGGETTGGAEPWQECLEQPTDLCEVCCERMSESGEQFEQCLAACG